jgi:hypothetical protein
VGELRPLRSGSAGGPAQLGCLVFGVVMAWAVPIVVVAGTLPLSASLTTAITAVVAAPISLMIGTALGVHRGGWRGYSLRARPAPRRNGLFASMARPSHTAIVGKHDPCNEPHAPGGASARGINWWQGSRASEVVSK